MSLHTLAVQLRIFSIISMCLAQYWVDYDAMIRATFPERTASFVEQSSNVPMDPPALHVSLAKCLGQICAFIKRNDTQTFPRIGAARIVGGRRSCSTLARSILSKASTNRFPLLTSSDGNSRSVIMGELSEMADFVTYCVTSSNWHLFFDEIFLNPGNDIAISDVLPRTEQSTLLRSGCYSQDRLSALIKYLCRTVSNMKRPAQSVIMTVLHDAIWSFIESYPDTFAKLVNSGYPIQGGTVEGGPEELFDILYSVSDGMKRKTGAWPAMSMLLVLIPNVLEGVVIDGENPKTAKKTLFMRNLRQALNGSKSADIAASCYVSLCKAAHYTNPGLLVPSALGLLVADFHSDLKSRLLDPMRPLASGEGEFSSNLAIECIVNLYPLDPENVSKSVFPALISNPSPAQLQLVGIEACIALASRRDNERFCEPLLSVAPQRLRILFLTCVEVKSFSTTESSQKLQRLTVTDDRSHVRRSTTSPSLSGGRATELQIMDLWRLDLRFLLRPAIFTNMPDSLDRNSEAGDVCLALAKFLGDIDQPLKQKAAANVLLAMFAANDPASISARHSIFVNTALPISLAVIRFVLESANDPDTELLAVQLQLVDVRKYRDFSIAFPSIAQNYYSRQGLQGLWTCVEITSLCTLTFSDPVKQSTTAAIVQCAASSATQASLTILPLFSVALFESPEEQPKNVLLRVLESLQEPTPGVLAAWDEILRRWKRISLAILPIKQSPLLDPMEFFEADEVQPARTPALLQEWINLADYLLACADVCTRPSASTVRVDLLLAQGQIPSRFFHQSDRSRDVERLLFELYDLLDNEVVRDYVVLILGRSFRTSKALTRLLPLKNRLSSFCEATIAPTLFSLGQALTITESAAGIQLNNGREKAMPVNPDYISLLGEITLLMISGFPLQSNTPEARPIILRLAIMCQYIVKTSMDNGWPLDDGFKERMIDQLLCWVSEEDENWSFTSTKELLLPILRALSPLLGSLKPLTSMKRVQDETPFSVEITTTFRRRFNILSTLVSKLTSEIHVKMDEKTYAEFEDFTVDAISDLIASNPTLSRKFMRCWGFQTKGETRLVSLKILRVTQEKGVRFEDKASPEDPIVELVYLLRQPDVLLASALSSVCTANEYDDLNHVLFKIFNTPGSIVRFLKSVIETETLATDHQSTLFRGNTFATRILTSYARTQGYHYLRSTLKDLILTLSNKPQEFSMDFDPHRETSEDDTASRNLEQMTEAFLVVITQSLNNVPKGIREICHHISAVVGERFPESVFTAIGGFIFLRFINPAIVSPETIDLDLPSDTREIRRSLVMITKVLQALANNVRFGPKEPGLRKLNKFMDENIFGMTRFLQVMSHVKSNGYGIESGSGFVDNHSEMLDQGDREFLHQLICDNFDQVKHALHSDDPTAHKIWHDGSQNIDQFTGSEIWTRLTAALSKMGPSPETSMRATAQRWSSVLGDPYTIFMKKHSIWESASRAQWGHVFERSSEPKTKQPLTYVLHLRKIQSETADFSLLLFHVFRLLESVPEPLRLMIDCTEFSKLCEVPVIWLKQFMLLLPSTITQRIQQVTLVRPNSNFSRYVKVLSRYLPLDKCDSRWCTAQTTNVVDSPVLDPFWHLGVGSEIRTAYENLTERSGFSAERPVRIEIRACGVVVSSMKRQTLFSDVKCVITDYLAYTDMIALNKCTTENGEACVKIDVKVDVNPRIYSSTTSCEAILHHIQKESLLYPSSLTRSNDETQAASRGAASYFPHSLGSVINAGFFNLCSNVESHRCAAYDLLLSLIEAHKARTQEHKAIKQHLFIPDSNVGLLLALSENLASCFPASTSEFLNSFAGAFDNVTLKEQAAYALSARYWLQNLADLVHISREERLALQEDMAILVRTLLRVDLQYPLFRALLTSRLWPIVGREELLIPIVFDEVFKSAVALDNEHNLDVVGRMGQILVALSAGIVLRGKTLACLRRMILKTAKFSLLSLSESEEWSSMAVLLRLDADLSFGETSQAQVFLPDILHICFSVIGRGTYSTRCAARHLLLNTLQHASVGTENKGNIAGDILKMLVSSESLNLFGLLDSHKLGPVSKTPIVCHWSVLDQGRRLSTALVRYLEDEGFETDTVNSWRARWASLSTTHCFQRNPELQSRAFTVLCPLISQEIDHDFLFQILTALRSSVQVLLDRDASVTISILSCLERCSPYLKTDSNLWPSFFWFGVCLLKLSCAPHDSSDRSSDYFDELGQAAISFINTEVDSLIVGGWFDERPACDVLLEFRDLTCPAATSMDLEDEFGVDFVLNFSFALASIMALPLASSKLQDSAADILYKLMKSMGALQRNSRGNQGTSEATDPQEEEKLSDNKITGGFFCALLPKAAQDGTQELQKLLSIVGSHGELKYKSTGDSSQDILRIAREILLQDAEVALLSFALLTKILVKAEDSSYADVDEAVYVAMLPVLHLIANVFPEVIDGLGETLLPLLDHVLSTSLNSSLVLTAQRIVQVILDTSDGARATQSSLDVLVEMGFAALLPAEEPGKSSLVLREQLARLTSDLVGFVLKPPEIE